MNSRYKVKEDTSTGAGRRRGQTVKHVPDFIRGRAFNNREDYEDVYTAIKDTVSLLLHHRASFQVNATKMKRNPPGTQLIKKTNAYFRAA